MSARTLEKSTDRLRELATQWRGRRLVDLFEREPDRSSRFRFEACDLCVDLSRQFVDEPTHKALLAHARAAGLEAARDRLFAGEKLNTGEDRAALHMALRDPEGRQWQVDGRPVSEEVAGELSRMLAFVEAVHQGRETGVTGQPFRQVLNIGIGGSHLGPELAVTALDPHPRGLRARFLSNVDPDHTTRILNSLDPATTLVVVTSKTFTSRETLLNAREARRWLVARLGEHAVEAHFCAVSTNREAVAEFGIAPARRFGFWDWVGGRYSLWSSVGVSAALAVGAQAFRELLTGAAAMDRHFENAKAAANLPIQLALLGFWNHGFLGYPTRAVVPYSDRLRLLPAYLQQLEMESNGKGVNAGGEAVECSSPVVWGGTGTDSQHSFFQLLHQGPRAVPVEFLLPGGRTDDGEARRVLAVNCLAQAQALMHGRQAGQGGEHYPGNRPSTLIQMPTVVPETLGALIALYEHKVFVEATLWGVNPFDQPGVELGKRLAGEFEVGLEDGDASAADAATRAAMEWTEGRDD